MGNPGLVGEAGGERARGTDSNTKLQSKVVDRGTRGTRRTRETRERKYYV
jgi:hypothetical protein